MKTIIACALVIFLAGCAIDQADFDSPEAYQAAMVAREARLERAGRYAEAARVFAVGQIEIWNAAGVDPIQWDENKLLRASAFCGTAVALATVVNPEMVSLSSEGQRLCGAITKALAEAPAN